MTGNEGTEKNRGLNPDSGAEHYLKAELYELVRKDSAIFEFLQSGSLDGLWYWDIENPEHEWLSPRFKQVFGYQDHEIPNSSHWWQANIFPEDLAVAMDNFKSHCVNPSHPCDQVVRYRHKNGSTVWIRCRGIAIRNAEGKPIRMLGAHTDVTAVKEHEQQLVSNAAVREEQQHFHHIIDHLPQMIWTCDSSGACDYLSRQWLEYTGKPEATQLGYGWVESLHPEDSEPVRATWLAAVKQGWNFQCDFRIRKRNGEYRWFESRGVPIYDGAGHITKWLGTSTDITERRRTDEALRHSEERFSKAFHSNPGGLAISRMSDGRMIYVNHAYAALIGYSRDEIIGRSAIELKVSDIGKREAVINLLKSRGSVQNYETTIATKSGRVRHVLVSLEQIHLEGDACLLAVVQDITERKLAEERLRFQESVLRETGHIAKVGGWNFDVITGEGFWTEEVARIHDLDPSDPVSKELGLSFYHGDSRRRIEAAVDAAVAKGIPYDLELEIVTKLGNHKFVRTIGHPVIENGKVTRVVGSFQDITEKTRADRRVVTRNAVSQALADSSTLSEAAPKIIKAICESEDLDFGAIWEVDGTQNLLRCAEVWHRPELAAVELAAGTRALNFAPGAGLPGRVWASARPSLIPDVALDNNYTRAATAIKAGLRSALAFPILSQGKVTGVMDFLGRDIRAADEELLNMFIAIGSQVGLFFERKRSELAREKLEGQLRMAQKMEAVGQLSAGIAHDFNNLLTAILGNARLAAEDIGQNHPAAQSLAEISRAGDRAKKIVLQILAFSRQQPRERQLIALAPVVKESVGLLRATLPAAVEVTIACDEKAPEVLADTTQIQQIILNLGTNSWHAFEERPGRIDITLTGVNAGPDTPGAPPHLKPGRHALLSVADNGKGMDAATMERMFDPFFTTKEPGKGTGLGLSVVHGVVQDHEGALSVSSAPGEGSIFRIFFPAAASAARRAESKTGGNARGQGQHILFIDDEEAIVMLSGRMLRRLGFRVTGFTRSQEAIEALRSHPNDFDLVITDMNMPGATGLQVAEELFKIRPSIPIAVSSGYVSEDLQIQARRMGIREVLYKPDTIDEFGHLIHRLIASASEPDSPPNAS